MITINERTIELSEFKPGTLIYDAESNREPKTVIMIVEGYDTVTDGCFAGVYLSNLRYSDGLSKGYRGWKLFEGSITIQND